MVSLNPRKQLRPAVSQPPSPPSPTVLGKRTPPGTPPADHPTKLVARRLHTPAPRPNSSMCVPGCLIGDWEHTGLCRTDEGVAPPSVKSAWARSKNAPPRKPSKVIPFALPPIHVGE